MCTPSLLTQLYRLILCTPSLLTHCTLFTPVTTQVNCTSVYSITTHSLHSVYIHHYSLSLTTLCTPSTTHSLHYVYGHHYSLHSVYSITTHPFSALPPLPPSLSTPPSLPLSLHHPSPSPCTLSTPSLSPSLPLSLLSSLLTHCTLCTPSLLTHCTMCTPSLLTALCVLHHYSPFLSLPPLPPSLCLSPPSLPLSLPPSPSPSLSPPLSVSLPSLPPSLPPLSLGSLSLSLCRTQTPWRSQSWMRMITGPSSASPDTEQRSVRTPSQVPP